MGQPGSPEIADGDLAAAYALASRVVDPAQRELLLKACGRAIEKAAADRVLIEIRALLEFWRSMPEHVTGSMAARQLEDVLAGGRAPRNSSTAAKR